MAKFYPPDPPEHSPKSELKLRARLAQVDDLVVLHSVAWQSHRNGRQGDGQADFVLVSPHDGILVLEVKGGGVELCEGKWYSTDGEGVRHQIKNPFEQATASKHILLDYLRDIDQALGRIPIVHGVVFPDIVVSTSLGPNAPRAIIVDRHDLNSPGAALKRVFGHWGVRANLGDTDIDRLVACLAPTTTIQRLLRDELADANRELIELTHEQVKILYSLRRVKRAAILGGAGTGKTVLAAEKARQLSSEGFRTLLICYNALLRKSLLTALSNVRSVEVETFHSLTISEARSANLQIPHQPDEAWFEFKAGEVLACAARVTGKLYDAILVDEAQDFATSWIASLHFLLANPDESLFYLFADSHQDLYKRDWRLPDDCFQFELTLNCRNTHPIAEKVANVFKDELRDKGANGPHPIFIEADRCEEIVPLVQRFVGRLLTEQGLSPQQIVVLTDDPEIVRELRSTGVSDFLFTNIEGYGIAVETVFRFKGLERDAVVLVLTDNTLARDLKAIAYVGLSRARTCLYVVGSHKIRAALAWDN